MTEELEKEAEIFVSEKTDKGNFDVEKFGKAYFSESSMKQALVKFAESREESREKRIAELEAQIEKMKCCANCMYEPPFDKHCDNCIRGVIKLRYRNWKLREIKENE